MGTKRLSPREIYSRNLKALLAKTGMSAPVVATKAKVDRKTVNNQLNMRNDLRAEQVQAVAEVFGYGAWDLLNPDFDPDKPRSVTAEKLERGQPPLRWVFSVAYEQYEALDDDEKLELDLAVTQEFERLQKRRERQRDKMPVKSGRRSAG